MVHKVRLGRVLLYALAIVGIVAMVRDVVAAVRKPSVPLLGGCVTLPDDFLNQIWLGDK